MIFEISLFWENIERFKKTINSYPIELLVSIKNALEHLTTEPHFGSKKALTPKVNITTWRFEDYLLYILSDVDEKDSTINLIGKMCVSLLKAQTGSLPIEKIAQSLDKSMLGIIESAEEGFEIFYGGAPPAEKYADDSSHRDANMGIDSDAKDDDEEKEIDEELREEVRDEKVSDERAREDVPKDEGLGDVKKKAKPRDTEPLISGGLTALASFATESSEEEMKKFNEKIARKATVFYRNRMIAEETNKLAVAIASHKIHEKLRLSTKEIARASSEKELQVTDSNPIIDIEPVFPNCICVPATRHIDARKEYDLAGFLITPLATGDMPNAHINLFNNGRLIDTIETPVKVVKTTAAKISGLITVVIPTIGQLFEDVITPLFEGSPILGTSAGFGKFLLGLAAISAIISLILYLVKKPRDAKPLHKVIEDQSIMSTVLSSMTPDDVRRIMEQK